MNLICKFPVRGMKPTKTLLKVFYEFYVVIDDNESEKLKSSLRLCLTF